MKHANISIFVPHIGCPHMCSFCNQHTIRSEEHTSELQSQSVISYAVFCLKKIFFNDTATTEIYTICYTLSLHDALPIFFIIHIGITKVMPSVSQSRPSFGRFMLTTAPTSPWCEWITER